MRFVLPSPHIVWITFQFGEDIKRAAMPAFIGGASEKQRAASNAAQEAHEFRRVTWYTDPGLRKLYVSIAATSSKPAC